MLSYAVTYARSSTKLSKEEQDLLSQVMVKVSAEVTRDGPHYIVGGEHKQKLTEKEASRIRANRLNRLRQNRLRGMGEIR